MKFTQLMQYDIRNIFFKKNHAQNVVDSQTLFLKIKVERISLLTVLNFIQFV